MSPSRAPARPRSIPSRRPLRSLGRAVSWHRRKLAVLAALFAVLTGLAAAAPDGPPTLSVVRTRSQLSGGISVAAGDVEMARVAVGDVPQGALTDLAEVVGQTLAAPAADGQIITALAFASARSAITRGRVLAPLRLADADLAALVRPGDQVDVIAADAQADQADVVARAVRIVTVPQARDPADGGDPEGTLVLVDVDPDTARVLARAAVSATLTVVWR